MPDTGPAPDRRAIQIERLDAVRGELRRRALDGFIVPHADPHMGEYLPASEERLAWLTGFTGSAGSAALLGERAALFVDGRYTLQAAAQVDSTLYAFRHVMREPLSDWLTENAIEGARIGYDPWLHPARQAKALEKACAEAAMTLVAVDDNPIDAVWPDQPPKPSAPAVAHPLEYAGKAAADKRAEIGADLIEGKADAAVLTATESICWLLNIRGGDVPNVPVVLCFAIVHGDGGVDLFIDPAKVDERLRDHFGDGVRLRDTDELGAEIDVLGGAGKRVHLDPASCPDWIARRLESAGATLVEGDDPCALPKAIKNPVEIAGAYAAHVRDGAALATFLAWLDDAAAAGDLGELDTVEKLASCRQAQALYQGPSFDTIAGAGANGAIVHYRPLPEADAVLAPGSLFLIDSGGQYLDGTTDVTRTVAIGVPSDLMRRRFTQVLKGHIAIAQTRFPEGATGAQLDGFARQHLWRDGVDYDHGTGHGVGSYLRVHEGPQGISPRSTKTALQPGMIMSNEPGYYKEGAFGIRIENLVVVTALDEPDTIDAEKPVLGFETLTLAPIDRRLVDQAMMTEGEIAWLDAYHARVRDALSPLVDDATAAWLAAATAPIGG